MHTTHKLRSTTTTKHTSGNTTDSSVKRVMCYDPERMNSPLTIEWNLYM
jgi:hypothetical protein